MAHALVLGGTRGLGREAVKLFSAAGYKVSVIGRREPPDTDRAIPGVKHWIADLGPDANIGATLDAIVKEHGALNYLVFCQRYRGSEDPWKGEIDVSLTLTKAVMAPGSALARFVSGRAGSARPSLWLLAIAALAAALIFLRLSGGGLLSTPKA